jgi:F-type H+-transporting ATPase subunit gamma
MDQKNKIQDEIVTSGILETLMQSYQEHAIQQINFSRNTVLASRDFAQELAEVFFNVKTSYENVLLEYLKKGKSKQELKGRGNNGKEVMVLLTANNKLYGDIVPKVSRLFIQDAKESNADIVVIGKQGKELVESQHLKEDFKYFDIPDTNFDFSLIKPAIEYLFTYSKVIMYYGKFNNIISQEAVSEDLSEDLPQKLMEGQKKIDFLFEPSLEDVLDFFETQIFSLMFEQKLHEASLARFASRIKAMELSQNNIKERLKKLHQRQKRLREMELNKKQLQLLSGKTLWGRR